jgi:hypothetical protein
VSLRAGAKGVVVAGAVLDVGRPADADDGAAAVGPAGLVDNGRVAGGSSVFSVGLVGADEAAAVDGREPLLEPAAPSAVDDGRPVVAPALPVVALPEIGPAELDPLVLDPVGLELPVLGFLDRAASAIG